MKKTEQAFAAQRLKDAAAMQKLTDVPKQANMGQNKKGKSK